MWIYVSSRLWLGVFQIYDCQHGGFGTDQLRALRIWSHDNECQGWDLLRYELNVFLWGKLKEHQIEPPQIASLHLNIKDFWRIVLVWQLCLLLKSPPTVSGQWAVVASKA